jgi:isoleucyl-tRNA synthetase
VVTKALEEARAAKSIAASLEAVVTLRGSAAALQPLREHEARPSLFPGNLANLFIVSRVVLVEAEGPLSAEVGRAEGGKCERCWTFSTRVVAGAERVCERCTQVLGGAA